MNKPVFSLFCASPNNECQLWHNWLDHPNSQKIRKITIFLELWMNKYHFTLQDISIDWSSCKVGKKKSLTFSHVMVFLLVFISFILVFGVLHLPFHMLIINIVAFIDDISRYISFMQNLEVFDAFKKFLALFEN